MLSLILAIACGGAVGLAIALAVTARQRAELAARSRDLVLELREHASAERDAAVHAALDHLTRLNEQTWQGHTAGQAAAARAELDARTSAVDAQVDEMRSELSQLREVVARLGQSSERGFGELTASLRAHAETTASLSTTTDSLRQALANAKTRGQWGERMADDVLRMAGFIENVNYTKQRAVEGGRSIPDFTFQLPKGHVLYMDVKFPLSAYLQYLDASSDHDRERHRTQFLRDVRSRVRELAARDYLDKSRATVSEILLFIPNEAVCAFIHEHDHLLIDEALRQHVVLCSPLTLFAMLAVIRQAFDNFVVEQTSNEVLRLMGAFTSQWERFTASLDGTAKKFEAAQRALDELTGVRRRQLEKPLARLDDLRRDRGLAVAPDLAAGAAVLELDTLGRETGARPGA